MHPDGIQKEFPAPISALLDIALIRDGAWASHCQIRGQ
jgi:hypothetical protein